jgi:multidrug resistance efflux pump
MSASDNGKSPNAYELRRQSRGGDGPPAQVRPWRRRLLVAGVVAGVLLLIGACVLVWRHVVYVSIRWARVQAAVVAISPRTGGRILSVHVREGEVVRAGDVLVRLDDREVRSALTAAQAELAIRQSALREAQSREALAQTQVQSGITVAESRVAVSTSRVAGLEVDLAAQKRRLPEQVRAAEAALAAKQAALRELEAGPRQEDVSAARERVASARATLALCELEVKQSRELVGEGIDSQYILEVRKTRFETQTHALREAELALQRLEAGARVEELEAARQAVEEEKAICAQVRLGEEDIRQTASELEVRAAELREAQALLRQAESRQAELEVARQQTEAAAAEVRRMEAVVDGRCAALADVEITSPIAGTVTRVFADVGETSRPGDALVLLADAAKPRWFDAFVDEKDARLVSVGQVAVVRVPANSLRDLRARVTQVGLHTATMDRAVTGSDAPAGAAMPDSVWVRLVPDQPLDSQTVTGTTARGRIRVR